MDQLLKDNQRDEKKRTGKELNIECCVWGHRMSQLNWDAKIVNELKTIHEIQDRVT